jgi:hypothetical protein
MLRVSLALLASSLLVFAACSSDVSGGGSTEGAGLGPGTGSDDVSDLMSCDEVDAEVIKERQSIQSCTTAAECGQELDGTSCGCTRSAVARLDADTMRFYALLDRRGELQCETLSGTCDCPNADGFVCTNGMCAWNYVP